jgi:nicotinamidase/pyrazinamidase
MILVIMTLPVGGYNTITDIGSRLGRKWPMSDVVIVVDMQRCFLEEDKPLYTGAGAREIIPRVQQLLRHEVQRGSEVLFTGDNHSEDDLEFNVWPRHCVAGTQEAEVIPELRRWLKPGHLIRKRRYSAFFETDLARRLSALKPDTIKVTGICTDICVMHTVADLRNRDYHVVVYDDGLASFDAESHRFGLRHMKDILGVEVRSIAAEAPEAEEAEVAEPMIHQVAATAHMSTRPKYQPSMLPVERKARS